MPLDGHHGALPDVQHQHLCQVQLLAARPRAEPARVEDGWGEKVDGLVVTLPTGWASADVAGVVHGMSVSWGNVGPSSPIYDDYR